MGKQYNVYGIGNALVDMEFQVSPELLQELGIDKGVMTLVDENRQTQLMEKLAFDCKRSGGGLVSEYPSSDRSVGG
ncbi:MAG UNVERIFIED_CONTAM: hypothetical protein LVR29_29165 [Microcystis novacekii LVE1205-3]|jgi:sugar/nucleoside kinase (ribokinase family)